MIKYKTEDEWVVNKQWVCDGFADRGRGEQDMCERKTLLH